MRAVTATSSESLLSLRFRSMALNYFPRCLDNPTIVRLGRRGDSEEVELVADKGRIPDTSDRECRHSARLSVAECHIPR